MSQPDPDSQTRFELARHWITFMAFRGVESFLKLLPLTAVWRLGRMMGAIAWLVAGKYRRLVLDNLHIAFGREKDVAWIRRTAREHFLSLFANIFCGFKLPTMTREQIEARVSLDGMEHMQAALDSGRPVLGLICHLSCWEILAQVPKFCSFGRRPATVYQPLRNPYLNAHVLRRRERQGYAVFSRHEGFHGPMKHMKEGGMLGILVDQHAGNLGVWCPFFDRIASTTPVVSMIALRTQAFLVALAVYDDGPARWKLVYTPFTPSEPRPSMESLTAQMNQVVEAMVRRQPYNWFWVHNRWKTPNPRFLLDRYRRGTAFPPGYDGSRLQPFELLVRSPNWLGDACMAFPAVRAIKAGRPDLRLTVFGPEKLRDLWEAQPEVDCYIGKQDRESLFSVARRLRSSGVRYSAGILLTNSTRSTLEFWLGGVRHLSGYPGSFRSLLLKHRVKEVKSKGPPQHHTQRYLHIAWSVGAEPEKTGLPVGTAPSEEGGLRIGICAGAEYGPAKRWPLERFAEVIKLVTQTQPAARWAFFGAPGEAKMGEQLSQLVGESAKHDNLVGKTRLAGLITELRRCHLLVTNDTGTMHLAAALGVPTVSIFGSTEPVLTGPLGDRHTVIRHQMPCSPCFKRECPFGHYECMTRITPEQVARAVLDRLAALRQASPT